MQKQARFRYTLVALALGLASTSANYASGEDSQNDAALWRAKAFEQRFKHEMNSAQEALDSYQRAVDIAIRQFGKDSTYVGELYYEMGALALDAKKPHIAEGYLKKSVQQNPNSVMARIKYSEALQQVGKSDECLQQIEATLAKHQNSPEAKEALIVWLQSHDKTLSAIRESYSLNQETQRESAPNTTPFRSRNERKPSPESQLNSRRSASGRTEQNKPGSDKSGLDKQDPNKQEPSKQDKNKPGTKPDKNKLAEQSTSLPFKIDPLVPQSAIQALKSNLLKPGRNASLVPANSKSQSSLTGQTDRNSNKNATKVDLNNKPETERHESNRSRRDTARAKMLEATRKAETLKREEHEREKARLAKARVDSKQHLVDKNKKKENLPGGDAESKTAAGKPVESQAPQAALMTTAKTLSKQKAKSAEPKKSDTEEIQAPEPTKKEEPKEQPKEKEQPKTPVRQFPPPQLLMPAAHEAGKPKKGFVPPPPPMTPAFPGSIPMFAPPPQVVQPPKVIEKPKLKEHPKEAPAAEQKSAGAEDPDFILEWAGKKKK